MILWLVMGFLADLVFKTASDGRRAYEAEIDRYLAERGDFRPPRARPPRRKLARQPAASRSTVGSN